MPNDTAPVMEFETLRTAFAAVVGAPTADQNLFLARVLEDFRPDELPDVSVADLAASLAAFWRFAESIPSGAAPAARLTPAVGSGGRDLKRDVLEIVQPDAPFLVDSVMGEVGDAGAEVQAMFHPVVDEDGRRRSMIQIWLAPVARERRDGLVDGILAALADVRAAVADFEPMTALMARSIDDLIRAAPGDPDALAEDVAFLRWVETGRFVFLGARVYDYPRTAEGGYAAEEPLSQPEASLGVLRDQERSVLRRASEPAVLSAALRRRLQAIEPVIVAKSNLRSRVHRRAYMDYIGVRRYGADGLASGEVRFVGLFTAEAYDQSARDIPMLRRKVGTVMAAAGFAVGSHNAVRLANILETYPRDELFQVEAPTLLETAQDILHLSDRPRIKLFVRRDPFDRFVSVLFFAPRERYDAQLRQRTGEILAAAFGGRVSAYYPSFSDAPLARVHFIIGVSPGAHRDPDMREVEARVVAAARTWSDDLDGAVRAGAADPSAVAGLLATYGEAFPAGYRDQYDAREAFIDMRVIEGLGGDDAVEVRAFRRSTDSPLAFRFKIYRRGATPIILARVTPILQDMGLRALVEEGFAVTPRDPTGGRVWVHEYLLEDDHGETLSFDSVKAPFEAAFQAIWRGRTQSDGFNRLVLEIGASWREAALIRGLARYRQQSGLDPSQMVQEGALAAYPNVARLILDLFALRFDPVGGIGVAERAAPVAALNEEIETALQSVASLDDDRVLRRLAALVNAVTRTNYYQPDESGQAKPHISFKVASRELIDLPAPKPFREIFVSAPNVEGVHLRMGPVARGGLRWSDRRDDFRTEVLGLVKAQQVKNAVIVPVGSKGGFFPKNLPRGGTPDAVRAEGVAAYKTFLAGLLDLTDNIDAEGAVVHPPHVVNHDGEDPYLVVAADKGTATFSDIANGVAADYRFWLGDAFASGGSVGYDHKAMAITARGAWESVKRHFRELGKDIQRDATSVVGVGDMSGDVFGNGMLLSQTVRLRAAFDHRHVFIDPEPDPAVSWAERKRLFALPRSSWDDYDKSLISAGGGVWPRALKSIPLSAPIKALLDVTANALAPNDLIIAILKSRTELLYLGGIGTYVKAAGESHPDVGDKANDAVRVNGADLRCRVVGEGANLGFTQAGRIEFALAGGRINTDAIDNSAGVDTSDHEVNIKILTGMAERSGVMSPSDRDPMLASMTDEIAGHVLEHNYDQTLALTLLEADAARDLDGQTKFMHDLEQAGRLDRRIEGLPDLTVIAQRAQAGKGLTRPELAVLLAYGKLDLFDDLIGSGAPDDPAFLATLRAYFPKALAPFEAQMRRHRLHREIVATVIGNQMVNLCGPTFPGRLRAAAGCDTTVLVTAFEAARQILRFDDVWARVDKLDGRAPAAGQTALYRELVDVLRAQTLGFARLAARGTTDVRRLTDAYRPSADALKKLVPAALSPFERKAAVRRAEAWTKVGAPKTLAHTVALMRPLLGAAVLSDLATSGAWPLAQTSYVYHRVGGQFGFDRLRAAAAARPAGDAYERLAMRRLIEDMLTEQAAVTGAVMAHAAVPPGAEHPERAVACVGAWAAANPASVGAARRTIDDIETAGGGWSFPKLTIANAALRRLAGG